MRGLHFIIFLFCLALAGSAQALEVSVPDMQAQAGTVFSVPLVIDSVDNLAGVKIVLKYDPKIIVFEKADKSRYTTSLLHVVNSQNPGQLIIVMAGARGIQGKEFPVMTLGFKANPCPQPPCSAGLEITEAQFMSDKLVNLAHTIKNGQVTVFAIQAPTASKDAPVPAPPSPPQEDSSTPPAP